MSRWEYMTFDCSRPKDDIEGLDKLGCEGREAVVMVSNGDIRGLRDPMVLLKRPLFEATMRPNGAVAHLR